MKLKKILSAFIAAAQLSILVPSASFAADTPSAVPAADTTAAVFADLSFTNEGIQDTSDYAKKWDVQPLSYGNTPVSYNEDLNLYEATFDNSANFYKLILNKELRDKMTNGYSIQAYFSPSEIKTMNIIGAAQTQGFDFEVLSKGTFDTCLNHGSGWVKTDGNTPGSNATISANQYYLMTVTYDGSNIKVYQNGELNQTVSSSGKLIFPTENQPDSKGDPYYGMVIGGDYNPTRYTAGGTQTGYAIEQTTAQGAFSGKIAQVKLYEGALTKEEVKASYDALQNRKNITSLDDLNAMLTQTLPEKQAGFEDDQDLTALIQEGWELMGKTDVTQEEISAYLTKAQDYTPKHPTYNDGVKLRVGVLSDYQYGRDGSNGGGKDGDKFKEALRQILAKAGGQENLDVLLLVGDISHNSYTQEYDNFIQDIEEVLPRETRHPKIIAIRGNHDAKEGTGSDSNKNIKDRRDNFLNKLREYDPSILTTNGIAEVNGYQFVYVSQDNQKGNDDPTSTRSYLHSPETVTAFENDMKTAASKSEGKPIFVVMHPNATDTVYGSYQIDGIRAGKNIQSDFWSTSELMNGLTPYKNAITFSGHSHWTISHPRSVQQSESGFYSLNTGGVNNMEIETSLDERYQPKRYGTSNENESSGYYFEVKTDETVEIHKMDFYRNSEFGDPIVINVNSDDNDGRDYTDNRDTQKPAFAQDAKVTVSDISINDCKISFPQATDQETEVTSYKAEYINQNTQETEKIVTASSYYWLKGTDQEVKENYFYLSDFSHNDSAYYTLKDNTSYKIKVTAIDAYGNESDPIYSDVFKTEEKVLMPLDEATVASAFFTSNNLMDNSNYAVENNMTVGTSGTTPISYNEELKRYEADASTDNSCYNVLLPQNRYSLLQTAEGYTIEAYFKPTELKAGSVIIGAAQSGGFDIEYKADGTLEVYVRGSSDWLKKSDGSYPGSNTKLEANQYYHVAATVTPSEVNVYLNGTLIDTLEKGSVFTPPTGTNMRDHYSMHLGGDYNNGNTNSQNQMTGKIVFGKLYQRALTADEVKEQYQDIEERKALTKVGDLKTMLEETLPAKFEASKDPKVNELISEGWLLMGQTALTDAAITEYLEKAQAYEPVMPEDDGLNLRFAVLSDYQYGRGLPKIEDSEKNTLYEFTPPNGMNYSEYTRYKTKEAFKQVIEKSKDKNGVVRLDAIMIPGDMTHNGTDAEYQNLVADLDSIPEIWSTTNPTGTVKLIFLRGNHDNNKDEKHDQTSNYYKYLSKYGVTGDNQVYDVNGYKFVMASQTTSGYSDFHNPTGVTYLHSEETIQWFNNQLKTVVAKEKEEGKPVFVGTHPNPYDTVYGSYQPVNPITNKKYDCWSTKDFYGDEKTAEEGEEVSFHGMKDYQNIISFSGHSHWTIQNPRSIWQGEFTALNTGSVNNMETENIGFTDAYGTTGSYLPKRYGTDNEHESTGYYVTVDKNNIVNIEGLDLYRKQIFAEYTIDVNDKDSWQYTDEKRDIGVPYFEEGAEVTVSNLSDSSFTINYPQAKDDHNEINFYEIKLVEKETGKTVANTPFITSSYYWTKGGEDQVDINTWDFTDLTSNTTYTVEIIPYNVYYKTGNPIQCEVKTEASIESQFKTVYDLNPDTAAIISGSTENLDTDAHGMTVDKTNTIWTPKVNASNTSMNQKVLSFTTRTGKTGSLFKLDFTKDTAISHDAFTKGHYLFTTQVGLLHKSTGNISLTLFGKDSSGSEKQVMKAVFNGQSGTDASKGYLVNNSGTRIGSMVSVEMGNKNDSWVSGYTTLKADINLEENTISAWIGSTKVVDNQPLDVTGITEITAFDCSISGDTATYGALFQYIRLGEPIGTAEDAFTAKISANAEDLLSGNAADVTVSFDNPAEETHTAALYIAAYDADGNLLTITKSEDKTITAVSDSITQSFTAPANTKTIKAFVWENTMKPLDMLKAEK